MMAVPPLSRTQPSGSPKQLPGLCLSAIEIQLHGHSFYGNRIPYENEEHFEQLKKTPNQFAYRAIGEAGESQILVVPLEQSSLANLIELPVKRYYSLVARLIELRLIDNLKSLELRRIRHGLERIRRQEDLITAAFGRLQRKRPSALECFHKYHRTILRVRHASLNSVGQMMMLTVEFKTFHEIDVPIADLDRNGLDVRGVEAFTINPDGRRQWLGRITRIDGDKVVVDSDDGEIHLDSTSTWIEPSSESFRLCFDQVLGVDANRELANAEWARRIEDVCGNGFVKRLRSVAEHLSKTSAIKIVPGLEMRFGDIVSLDRKASRPDAIDLPQISYSFSADGSALHQFPAVGLQNFGPYDSHSFEPKRPEVLVVSPVECRNDVDEVVNRLRNGTGDAGKGTFRHGITGIYRLNGFDTRTIQVPLQGLKGNIGRQYVNALTTELGSRKAPDLALVVIRDEDAFVEQDNPYLAAKAFLLRQGIPSQEIRLSKIRSKISDLAYILRDVAVAIYAKLGGTPWTIRSQSAAKEVVLGMAHAEFGNRRSTRTRYMGITTVFNNEGIYLLAAGTPRCRYDDYPRELTRTVRDVLKRLAVEYGWTAGDKVRLVFHATKPLTGNEIEQLADEALEAVGEGITVEAAFLTIELGHPFKVLSPYERGRKQFVELIEGGHGSAMVGECAPPRGLVVNLGSRKRLLCVNGPLLMKREGESLPQPLQIELHRRSSFTDIDALVRQVFNFTGLSWRSMLPVTEPVTINYPHLIARLLGRFSALPGWSDDLLDTRLRRSRWFL
jgi:hypothetical protein